MKTLTIAQIEEQLKQLHEQDTEALATLMADERKGVQQLVAKWKRKKEQERKAHQKFFDMSQYEQKHRQSGYQMIAGIDEVGRGPLAGPVVAAAVILPDTFYLPGIDDSKKLSEQRREELFECIQAEAIAVSIGMVSAEEIDRINIYEATKKAMLTAIAGLSPKPDILLIDAMKLDTPYPYEAIIKGDAKSISIAAASIIAKVTRDRLMKELALTYPQYGFESNMGYGTKEHLAGIENNGVTIYHRKSFSPIKDYIEK